MSENFSTDPCKCGSEDLELRGISPMDFGGTYSMHCLKCGEYTKLEIPEVIKGGQQIKAWLIADWNTKRRKQIAEKEHKERPGDKFEWKKFDENSFRAKVPGGWLIKIYEDTHVILHEGERAQAGYEWRLAITFMPDPQHDWKVVDE